MVTENPKGVPKHNFIAIVNDHLEEKLSNELPCYDTTPKGRIIYYCDSVVVKDGIVHLTVVCAGGVKSDVSFINTPIKFLGLYNGK